MKLEKVLLFAALAVVGCCNARVLLADDDSSCKPEDYAPPCPTDGSCKLPDCACPGSEPDVPLADRPQIVYLTYDDAFTALAEKMFYHELYTGALTNPDGCPIRATHFLTARSMDYSLVNKYHAMGHEMAAHSISHRSPPSYWKTLNESQWEDEMYGMKKMIHMYGKIPLDDIKGVRAPYLQGGGDAQYNMMKNKGFEYDCTMPSQTHGYIHMDHGWWPYTEDYSGRDVCQIEPCPRCSHPGIWNQPILDLEDDLFLNVGGHGFPCGMLDSCNFPNATSDEVFNMLMRNFNRSYNGLTRAPFGLYVHAAWFFGYDWRFQGYKQFLEHITTFDDVWVVPINAGREYRKAPVTNDELKNGALSQFFGCSNFPAEDCISTRCKYTNVKNEDFDDAEEYLTTCDYCPKNYPWLGNPEGN